MLWKYEHDKYIIDFDWEIIDKPIFFLEPTALIWERLHNNLKAFPRMNN